MPVMFRPCSQNFKQSMRQAHEITSLQDVQQTMSVQIPLHCNYHGYNERNGWDEYAVVFYGGGVVGFTNGFLDPVG